MIEFLQSVGATWGIGAVFAILLFFVLMRLMKYYTAQIRDDRKFMEDRLTGVIDKYDKASKGQQRATTKHSKVLTELITLLKGRNGHG